LTLGAAMYRIIKDKNKGMSYNTKDKKGRILAFARSLVAKP
jgi:hypothetical protein